MQDFVKTLIQISSQHSSQGPLLTDPRGCCIVLTRNVSSMKMQDDPRDTARRIAALAGVHLAEERIAALALALPFVQAGVAALAAVDYRDADPTAQFPPRPKATP